MRKTIVLTGDSRDAETAADWAEGEARRADLSEEAATGLRSRVLKSYRAACEAFFAEKGSSQLLMVSLDLTHPEPSFELIADGEQARGTVTASKGLKVAARRREGLLDGLTCVTVPA